MNYNYNYDYSYYEPTSTANLLGAFSGAYTIFMLLIGVFSIVCMWKIFTKAGREGWKSIIPIYSYVVLLEIAGLPGWYILLFLVPGANIYAIFKLYIELAHKFGKSTGFGVASVFFSIICLPIIAFDKSKYLDTTSANYQNNVYPNAYNQQMNSQPNTNQNLYNQQVNTQTELNNNQNINNESTIKTCQYCGNKLNPDSNFCPMCGRSIN